MKSFKQALREIVVDQYKPVKPHQVGWLRRPEIDAEGCEVWEHPDGRLFAHDPHQGPLMLWIKIKNKVKE